jgi:hypothetical protein
MAVNELWRILVIAIRLYRALATRWWILMDIDESCWALAISDELWRILVAASELWRCWHVQMSCWRSGMNVGLIDALEEENAA